MMLTMMLPGHVTTIPRYIMFRGFGWVNTILPMVVPRIFATDAFFIFLLVQFWPGLAFHAFALVFIWRGYASLAKIRAADAARAQATAVPAAE